MWEGIETAPGKEGGGGRDIGGEILGGEGTDERLGEGTGSDPGG